MLRRRCREAIHGARTWESTMLTLTMTIAAVAALCMVMWGADEEEEMMDGGGGWAPIKSHGQGLQGHGKQLQEKAAGGKKCPKCGHPIG